MEVTRPAATVAALAVEIFVGMRERGPLQRQEYVAAAAHLPHVVTPHLTSVEESRMQHEHNQSDCSVWSSCKASTGNSASAISSTQGPGPCQLCAYEVYDATGG